MNVALVSEDRKLDSSSFTSRRAFLKDGVIVGAATLGSNHAWAGALALQPELLSGAPKNFVSNLFDPLSSALLPSSDWRPYPAAGDPQWKSVPEQVRESLIVRAEVVNASQWPEMLATDELEFKRNGNRSRFETVSFGRRNRLGDLVLAECIVNQGKYLDQIANGVWLICEESFWGVPAHLGAQRAGVGLADVEEPIIELFGAETSATLAWVVYLLGRQLDTISPRIVERVHAETKRRILDPYYARSDFSWMGLSGSPHRLNNWNSWINSNVLTANLLLEKDSQRRQALVKKICRSIDEFLNDYSPDGGCEEGPGYWARSAGSFFDCCWTLVSAHSGQGASVFRHPFVRAMAHYICNVHIANNYYVNYGDAHPHDAAPPDLAYRFGLATADDMLQQFGAFDARAHGTLLRGKELSEALIADRGGVASLSRSIARVIVSGEISKAPARDALPRDSWYPHLGLMTARQEEGTVNGFYVAMQAASNGRSHGHNDSGSFIVFFNGEPVFIDVGPEGYTAKTFGKDRYTLWPMQSAYHNLPTIGGIMQHEGVRNRAVDLRYETNDREASLRAELAPAYPEEAHTQRWTRTLTLDRAHGTVIISEDFALGKVAGVALSFMSLTEPILQEDGVRIGDALLRFDKDELKATVEKIIVTDETMKHSWGEAIYRLQLNSLTPVDKKNWRLEICPFKPVLKGAQH